MKKQFLIYAAGLMCTLSTPSSAQNCPGTTVGGGSFGSGATQLNFPYGVAIDGAGNIYVADSRNNRVQKFAPGSTQGTTVAGDGSFGSGLNQLKDPRGVAVDKEGNIYVADRGNHRIQKFAPGSTSASNGTTVAGITGSSGTQENRLYFPEAIVVDGAGNIYVADKQNHRIQKFAPGSSEGKSGTTVAGTGDGTSGTGATQLNSPGGVAVDGAGNIYVADQYNHRIQKFAPNSTQGSNGTTVAGTGDGTSGPGATQLNVPSGVAVDGAGNIYVADEVNHRIQKFVPGSLQGSSGTTVAGTGTQGSEATQLNYPVSVAVDGGGNIYVADQNNHRIQKFTPQAAAATIGSLTADETGCPVRLRASGNGQQFVFTGPQGYVFSQVYRTRGDYQPVAIDVRQPGTYRLTANVSGGCGSGNTTAVQTVTVTRSCP